MIPGRTHENSDPAAGGTHNDAANGTKVRRDGVYLLLFGAIICIALSLVFDLTIPVPLTDLMEYYYGSRCFLQHQDPYQPAELWNVYQKQGGYPPSNPAVLRKFREVVSVYTNPPTTLVFAAPFAFMPWKLTVAIWLALICGSIGLACHSLWRLGSRAAPRMYSILIFLVLINSSFFLFTGNTAGMVIGLCIAAACSLVQERFAWVGVAGMAVSLLLKPHDAALIWLYFLLAGGAQRKRAVQAAVLAAGLALPAVLWVTHVAPHWLPEYRSNLLLASSPGGRDDPGPTAGLARGPGMIICLQTLLSLIRNDPHFYNPVAYAICGALLIVLYAEVRRSSFSAERAWLALAAISAVTLLPVYHRTYDARLLLLAIPACVLLWKRGGPIGWSAMLLTVTSILITGDLFWIVFLSLTHFSDRSGILAMIFVPLTLLALSLFYLWIYLRGISPRVGMEAADAP